MHVGFRASIILACGTGRGPTTGGYTLVIGPVNLSLLAGWSTMMASCEGFAAHSPSLVPARGSSTCVPRLPVTLCGAFLRGSAAWPVGMWEGTPPSHGGRAMFCVPIRRAEPPSKVLPSGCGPVGRGHGGRAAPLPREWRRSPPPLDRESRGLPGSPSRNP